MTFNRGLLAGVAVAMCVGAWPARAEDRAKGLAAEIAQVNMTPQGRDKVAVLARYRALKEAADRDPKLDPLSRATAERLFAVGLSQTGSDAEAMAAFDRGIAILQAAHEEGSSEMAELFEGKAQQLLDDGKPDEALLLAQRALAVERAIYGADSAQLFTIEDTLGLIESRRGRLDDSLKWFRTALSHKEVRPTDRYNHVVLTSQIGTTLSRVGEDEEAVQFGYKALAEASDWVPEGDRGWGVIYSNLARWLINIGRYDAAEAVAMQALAYNRKHFGLANLDTGVSLKTLGTLKLRQGALDEAASYFQQALPALRDPVLTPKYRYLEGDAYRGIAEVEIARQNYPAAEKAALDGLAAVDRNKDQTGFSGHLGSTLAKARFLRGAYAEALTAIDPALVQLRKMFPPQAAPRIEAELLRARILAALGRKAEAWEAGAEQGRLMEARLSDPKLGSRSLLAVIADQRANLLRYAVLAAETGQPESAFRAAQLASFSEIGVASRAIAARVAGGVAGGAEAMRAVADLQVELEQLERQRAFAVGRAPAEVQRIDARREAAGSELAVALDHLRQRFPQFDALTRPGPLESRAAASSLRADQAIMLPIHSDDRMVVLVLRRNGLSLASARLDGSAMAATLLRLRAAVDTARGAGFDPVDAWKLGGALFNADTLAALRGARDVAVVGSGPLMTLPFGMLLTAPPVAGPLAAQPYAIKRFAFAVRPSLDGGTGGAVEHGGAFLGVGAPVLGPAQDRLRGGARLATGGLMRGGTGDAAALRALPSLPATAAELTAIAQAIPAAGNRVLTGAAANEAAVRAEPLERYGVIAFATHGLVSGELNGLSEPALVLTPPDAATSPDNDGLLTASEAAGLRLKARWVILSACNTGAGAENGAGGYSGLARGFMQAGAESLLVSLWPLRDDAAARLTVDTVRFHAKGASQAQALRQAALKLMRDRKVPDAGNPAVWAPFSLVTR